ncbi:hypothetical protein EDD21DRAFT_380195 [Dissophora ornata]|nr:hypothetical protein EDD21DRAFT_380195 [Dissophora ornata]
MKCHLASAEVLFSIFFFLNPQMSSLFLHFPTPHEIVNVFVLVSLGASKIDGCASEVLGIHIMGEYRGDGGEREERRGQWE